jgi:hypothetical protein
VIRETDLSALQHFAKLARLTTVFSGVSTILCAVAIFGFELSSWIESGVWQPYRVSWVLELLSDQGRTYTTASANTSKPDVTIGQAIVEWLLSIPVTGLLLAIAALHLLFFLYIPRPERASSTH